MSMMMPPLSLPAIRRLVPRPQIVATRGRFPVVTGGAGATNYTRWENEIYVRIGPRPVNNIRLLYTNRYGGSNGEITTNAADYTLEAMCYQNSAVSAVTFGGAMKPAVSVGASLVQSDELGFLLPANYELMIRTGGVIASGAQIVLGQPSGIKFKCVSNTSGTSQVYTTAGLVANGGATASFGMTPVAVIGEPDQRHVSVLIWGDSIAYGSGDTADATYGHTGWVERGLIGAAAGGLMVPFSNVSKSGDKTGGYNSGFSYGRVALLKYTTHAIFTMSTNDLITPVPLATIQANCQAIWAQARRQGVRAYHTTMTPKTTGTFADAAGQTVVANYESAVGSGNTGMRAAFNAWLWTQVSAGNLDGVIDVNSVVEDAANPGKWRTDQGQITDDGLHPNAAGHVLMAGYLTPIVQAWAV